jgi:hypothetical protein
MRTVRWFSLLLAASFSLSMVQGYWAMAQERSLVEPPRVETEGPPVQDIAIDPESNTPSEDAGLPDEAMDEAEPEVEAEATTETENDSESRETEASSETVETDETAETDDGEEAAETDEEELDPAAQLRRELIFEADRLYLAGDIAAATDLYRKAKTAGWQEDEALLDVPATPFTDEASLSPGAAVYWRESARGIEAERESQILVPLALLTTEYPAFIPGHLRYVEQLIAIDRPDDAEMVLEQALTLYPANPELLQAQVQLMMNREQWIEASIAARQFALLNPDHPDAKRYEELATENLERFKSTTNAQIRNNAIANIITGVAGYVLTGGLYGPFTALNSTFALLQGEEALGARVADQVREQLPLLEDEAINAYVDCVGQKLAAVAGRDDFEYTFDVVLDEELNAFALPGGKVFVNAGAILDTDSEAELAGLLAHEISHAVLSHGFQLVTQGNLAASVTQYLPLPGLVTSLLVNGYSRQMERQADIVGTQILAASGYAADGMHGLMLALQDRYGDRQVPSWLSTHPLPQERVDYLQAVVERGGYNRYSYEGIAPHEYIQALTAAELEAHEAEQAADGEEPNEAEIEDAVEDVKDEQEDAAQASETTSPESANGETVVTEETPSPEYDLETENPANTPSTDPVEETMMSLEEIQSLDFCAR